MDSINSLVGITQTVRTANVATVASQPKTTTETKTGFDTYSKAISEFVCHLHLILLSLRKLHQKQKRPQAVLVENLSIQNTLIRSRSLVEFNLRENLHAACFTTWGCTP
jgi:hypothetical protein